MSALHHARQICHFLWYITRYHQVSKQLKEHFTDMSGNNSIQGYCNRSPFLCFISVVCWAPVDLDPREMVTPGSFNR
jgi:hypothetical protein